MELPVVGRVENPDDLDLDPIVVPIAGYTIKDKKEVVTKIKFRPVLPLSSALDVIRQTQSNGNVPGPAIMEYLDSCITDEDAEKWAELLARRDLAIQMDTLIEVYRQLTEFYSGERPTPASSDSPGGRSQTGTTSKAGAAAKASKSKRKASAKR